MLFESTDRDGADALRLAKLFNNVASKLGANDDENFEKLFFKHIDKARAAEKFEEFGADPGDNAVTTAENKLFKVVYKKLYDFRVVGRSIGARCYGLAKFHCIIYAVFRPTTQQLVDLFLPELAAALGAIPWWEQVPFVQNILSTTR